MHPFPEHNVLQAPILATTYDAVRFIGLHVACFLTKGPTLNFTYPGIVSLIIVIEYLTGHEVS